MPDDQKPLLTDLVAQAKPDPEEVVSTIKEYITHGMFIQSDVIAQNLDRINFSDQQLAELSVIFSAGVEQYQGTKLANELGRARDYIKTEITRRSNPNGKSNRYNGM